MAKQGRKGSHEGDGASGTRKSRRVSRSVSDNNAPTVASSALGGDVAFKYIWKELRNIGWTSKAPSSRSLDTCYTYIRPGGRLDGDDGVDFLVGELSVLQYYNRELEMEAASVGLGISDATRSPDPEANHGTSARIQPVLIQNVYVDKLVAFSPDKAKWMKAKAYQTVGATYIIGRVCRQAKMGKYSSLFQLRWLDTQFQENVENFSVGLVQDGIRNYVALTRANNPDWRVLVELDLTDEIAVDGDMSDFEEDTTLKAFDPEKLLPTSIAELEAIKSMRFDPSVQLDAPSYLSNTYLRSGFVHLFEHAASSTFFTYIPVYFWRQVLHESNSYAVAYNVHTSPFTLSELMKFLGSLFYMAVNDKGEYANYWGLQAEDPVFGGVSTSLDSVMTLHRFKQLRRCFSFNATPTTLPQDAAGRIRPLLNLLKITNGKYIHVGHDFALDEASVACRSRQGRHMIRLDCCEPQAAWQQEKRARPTYTPPSNFFQELRLKSLYGRDTVCANSKHYPAHTILNKGDYYRGDYKIAVSSNHGMLAASWCDGNVVNMVSNADSTKATTVKRMLGNQHREFPAPECVANYNNNIQGVDKLDQIRGRFSVADGHSYKRWPKQLALALIDVARSNSYLT
ncbi:hypothetical protein PHMEG_0008429 [Phytophthora megakarya]|uniref:PiggyBac transposable element-derived protein domain-containing protein n=1 Tax=Phytophthora megakarya TaxID=4795 RepID=A0A225WIS3_9STRA|nr:hypothetical protein PHMEG_0008429 [Phytophthora megakarya]